MMQLTLKLIGRAKLNNRYPNIQLEIRSNDRGAWEALVIKGDGTTMLYTREHRDEIKKIKIIEMVKEICSINGWFLIDATPLSVNEMEYMLDKGLMVA